MPQSKTQTGKLNKKSKTFDSLYSDPSYKQGRTKTQNKGLVEDSPIKWRAKKKQELQFSSLTKLTLIVTKTKRKKEGHYIMVKGSMQQQESVIINIYAPNTGTPRYIRQVLNDL